MTEQLFTRDGSAQKPNSTKGNRPAFKTTQKCSRCGGHGGADKWAATGWKCYRCDGQCIDPNLLVLPLYTADQLAKLNATAAKKAANRAAKAEAAAEAKRIADEAARAARKEALAADPFFQLLTTYAPRNEFIADMLGKLRVRDLSDAQMEAARKACDRLAAADKAAATSRHVGVIGERVKLDVVVKVSRCIHHADPSGWRGGIPDSNRYLLKMEDAAGNVVVWFTANGYKEGAQLTGSATVAKHDEYKGVAQTTVKNFRIKKGKDE